MHSLVTEHNLVSRSTEFEAVIRDAEKTSLRALCDRKSQESLYVVSVKSTYGFQAYTFLFTHVVLIF